jgi:outer membrane protein TolC
MSFPGRTVVVLAAATLTACAGTAIDDNLRSAQQLSRERLGADLQWLSTDEARRKAADDVDALLAKPLSADDAVRITLAYSPALQALLFDAAADSAGATQAARLPNPVFAFERLSRDAGGGRELEINRSLSFSLLDILLLPARLRAADRRQEQIRLQLAGNVVQAATDARQAWVRAVAAQQALQYAGQVKASADAGSELARRMQAAGNYSKLQRAREQAFAAEAQAQLARTRQHAQGSREALVRALGLDERQAQALKLPDRLPDLPAAMRDEKAISEAAVKERLDVRMAQARLDALSREQGAARTSSIVNGLEAGIVRDSETGLPPKKGFELQVPLPVFDTGDAIRSQADARTLAALNRRAQAAAEAGSQLREAYGAYRGSYELARHYRDEIVPLRKSIADENLLRYNGMLIGVFELLADAREQVGSVVQALEAQRDFWLADAALQAALIGRPSPVKDPEAP